MPVRGRDAINRADGCWLPIETALTPHDLRHSYTTLMEELGTSPKLMDAQMGHSDGSIQAVYSHVTPAMVARLLDGLTQLWHAALDAREALGTRSPVLVLDRLLTERRKAAGR
jgi:integrase